MLALYISLFTVLMPPISNYMVDSIITEIAIQESIDPKLANYAGNSRIIQYFFCDVEFFEIDTTSMVNTSEHSNSYPFMFAIDKQLRTFKLAGFNTNEYNNLINAHPIRIDTNNAYQYGIWIINLFYSEASCSSYNIKSKEDLLKLQYQIQEDKLIGFLSNHPEKTMRLVNKRIDSIFCNIELDTNIRTDSEDYFTVNYYSWEISSGNLVHYILSLKTNGDYHLKNKYILVKDLGFWINRPK